MGIPKQAHIIYVTRTRDPESSNENVKCEEVTSVDNEVHEMKNFLSCPTILRYSEFNSHQLNLQCGVSKSGINNCAE